MLCCVILCIEHGRELKEAARGAGGGEDGQGVCGDSEAGTQTQTQTHRRTDTQTHRRTDAQTHRHTDTTADTHASSSARSVTDSDEAGKHTHTRTHARTGAPAGTATRTRRATGHAGPAPTYVRNLLVPVPGASRGRVRDARDERYDERCWGHTPASPSVCSRPSRRTCTRRGGEAAAPIFAVLGVREHTHTRSVPSHVTRHVTISVESRDPSGDGQATGHNPRDGVRDRSRVT